jgi:hypothetical protein
MHIGGECSVFVRSAQRRVSDLYAWQAMHQGRGAGVGRGEDGGGTGVM